MRIDLALAAMLLIMAPSDVQAQRMNRGSRTMRDASGTRMGRAPKIRKEKVQARDSTVSIADLQAPKDARKAYERGLQQISEGEFTKARELFEKAIGIYPEYPSAWYQLGRIYGRSHEQDKAKDAYRQAVASDPKSWRAYRGLAEIAAREQDWPELARTTDKALAAMPLASSRLYVLNAVGKYAIGDYHEAADSAEAAIERGWWGATAKAYHIIGLVQAQRGQLTLASRNLQRYLALRPDAADAGIVRAQLAQVEAGRRKANGEGPEPPRESSALLTQVGVSPVIDDTANWAPFFAPPR